MSIELQFSPSKFSSIFRERVKKELVTLLCQAQKQLMVLETWLLDRVELGSTELLPNSLADEEARVSQQLEWVFTKRETLLKTKQASAPPADLKAITTLVFGVRAALVNGNTKLEVRLRDTEATTPDFLAKLIVSQLNLALQNPVTVPLELGGVVDMADGADLVRVGLAADASLMLVAVRLDFAPSGMSAAAWSEFFTGSIADTLGGREWSVLIDKSFIETMVEGIASDILAKVSDFKLSSGPTASWDTTASGTAELGLKFSGEAKSACSCFGKVIDLDVDVTMDLTLRLKEPEVLPNTGEKVLQVHAKIDVDKSFWESACCVVTAALMWPYVGDKFVAGELHWSLQILRMIGGVGNLIDAVAMAIGLFKADLPLDKLPESSAKKLSDDEFIYEMRVLLGESGFGKLTAEEAAGISKGLVLRGSIVVAEKTMPVAHVAWPVKFAWKGPCGSGLTLGATVHILNQGQLPLTVCSAEVLNVANVFSVKLPSWSQGGAGGHAKLEVTAWKATPLQGLSTACELLIRTTGGVRFLSIPSVAAMSEQEWASLKGMRDTLCAKMAISYWNGKFPIPEPDPAIDPTSKVVHVVHALIGGLEPGETVSAHYGEDVLATATAAPDGSAQLSAFLEQTELGGRLVLSRTGTPISDAEFERKPRQIDVQHTLLEVAGSIRLRSAATHLSLGQLGGARMLLVSTEADLRAFDISRPAVLRSQLVAAAPRLRGAISWGQAVLGWGEEGLLWFDESGVLIGVCSESQLPVLDVVRYQDYVYALTASSIVVYRSVRRAAGQRPRSQPAVVPAPVELERIAAVDAEGVAMVLAAGHLVLGSKHGLTLYDLTEPAAPKRVRDHPMEDTLDLRRAPLVSGGDMVFVGRTYGGSVYELGGHEPREILHFKQDPWFARAVWSDSALARVDRSRTLLTVYRVTRATTIGGLAGIIR